MNYRGNQLAMPTLLVRALSFSAVAALMLNPALTPAYAADEPALAPVGEQAPIVSPVSTVGSTKVRLALSTASDSMRTPASLDCGFGPG